MIRFLKLEHVVAEQLNQLTTYGGGQPGIAKPGSLESAVGQPMQTFGGAYLYADLHEMATAYLVGLVMGHAFANGNKRIGLASALMFLFVNGIIINATADEAVALVLEVIDGKRKKEDVAEFFRSHVSIVSSTHALRIEGMEEDSALLFGDASTWVNATYAEAFEVLAQ